MQGAHDIDTAQIILYLLYCSIRKSFQSYLELVKEKTGVLSSCLFTGTVQ